MGTSGVARYPLLLMDEPFGAVAAINRKSRGGKTRIVSPAEMASA
ncbi:hypothetical protein [Pseudomonas tehranensis]|nr:hypothetical protein [Pseudomonas tehranensis]